jgi:AcrR family transcriptional regulator
MTVQSATAQDPAKRWRLVDSAADVFSRVGFERASVEEIASGADVAKGTVYLYFENKTDLFLAVLSELRQRIEARSAAAEDASADAALRRLIRTQLEVADAAPDLFRCYTSALFGVNRDFQVAARETFDAQKRAVARTLRRAPAYGRRGARAIDRRASLFVSAVLAAALVRGLDGGRGRRQDDEDALIALVKEPAR